MAMANQRRSARAGSVIRVSAIATPPPLIGSSSVLVERSAIRIIWVTLIFVRLFIE